MLHFCAALAKCVSRLALVIPVYNNAIPARGWLLNFALAIHTQMSMGQEGGREVTTEPALRSELLQGLRALQGGGDEQAKSLKDGVICTVVATIEQGGITDFRN